MRIWKPTLASIYGLLGVWPPTTQHSDGRVAPLRQAMLDALAEAGDSCFSAVARRIDGADDAQSLWFLRADLMAVLAARYGEERARERMREISDQFEGVLPRGLRTRASPLAH